MAACIPDGWRGLALSSVSLRRRRPQPSNRSISTWAASCRPALMRGATSRAASATTCWCRTRSFSRSDIKTSTDSRSAASGSSACGDKFDAGPGPRLLPGDRARGRRELRRTSTAARLWRTSSCASCRSPRRSVCCRSATTRRVQPYVGAGVGVFGWRYSEYRSIRRSRRLTASSTATFVGTGMRDVGPVVLGGVRVADWPDGRRLRSPVADGEGRPAAGPGALPARKIDLGGMNYLFTFNIRF